MYINRRRFIANTAITFAATRLEIPGLTKAQTRTSFGPIKQIDAGLLNVGYAEAGPTNGRPVILLHGWPYDIYSYVDVAPLLAAKGYRVIVPYLRGYGTTQFLSTNTLRNAQQSALALDWWYQYYFATERGRAGYEKYRHDFNKLIWQLASPKWNFDDATFDRSAASFDNADHVQIVVHNYRWRLGVAEGERQYDDLERRLAQGPAISVPTITLEGDANGAPHPDPGVYAKKFSGKYSHRVINGGVGHNLPQEAPQAFADAVVEVDIY